MVEEGQILCGGKLGDYHKTKKIIDQAAKFLDTDKNNLQAFEDIADKVNRAYYGR